MGYFGCHVPQNGFQAELNFSNRRLRKKPQGYRDEQIFAGPARAVSAEAVILVEMLGENSQNLMLIRVGHRSVKNFGQTLRRQNEYRSGLQPTPTPR